MRFLEQYPPADIADCPKVHFLFGQWVLYTTNIIGIWVLNSGLKMEIFLEKPLILADFVVLFQFLLTWMFIYVLRRKKGIYPAFFYIMWKMPCQHYRYVLGNYANRTKTYIHIRAREGIIFSNLHTTQKFTVAGTFKKIGYFLIGYFLQCCNT